MQSRKSKSRRRPARWKRSARLRGSSQFRCARLEHLEPRRMLTGPFAGIADSLQSEVSSIQTSVDGAVNTLKSLPFIGQQLRALNRCPGVPRCRGSARYKAFCRTLVNASPKAS